MKSIRKKLIIGMTFILFSLSLAISIPTRTFADNKVGEHETDFDLVEQYIDEAIENYLNNTESLGTAIGIVYGDNVIFKNHGLTEENGKNITENTVFQIASISKVFTTIIISHLINQGKLSLDDTLSKFYKTSPSFSDITILQLLTHTSGLPYDYSQFRINSDIISNYLSSNTSITPEYIYSNLGFYVLGDIISNITGYSYDENIKKLISNSLKINDTAVNIKNTHINRIISPHNNYKYNNIDAAAYGLHSNVLDLTKFIKGVIKAPILKNDLDRAIINSLEAKSGGALGWYQRKVSNEYYYFHSGKGVDQMSMLLVNPYSKYGVVILSNGLNYDDVRKLSLVLERIIRTHISSIAE